MKSSLPCSATAFANKLVATKHKIKSANATILGMLCRDILRTLLFGLFCFVATCRVRRSLAFMPYVRPFPPQ